jgi:DNA-damage-inducible protein J
MIKSATVRARIEPKLKHDVEHLFHDLGLSTTDAINIFYRQVKLRNGLPFPVIVPNETTKKVFQDTDAGENIIRCANTDEMFEKLEL